MSFGRSSFGLVPLTYPNYHVDMLRSERPFPRDLDPISPTGATRDALRALGAAVQSIRIALLEIDDAVRDLENQEGIGNLRLAATSPDVPEIDPLIYRVDQLRDGCEEILRRPLNGLERTIVINWAGLHRDAVPVPVTEILDLTRTLLSRPTPDGTLPGTLKWCETTVQTLARAPVAALRARGARREQASELASLYTQMADELDSQRRGEL
jgi:hypothetical protein